MTFNKVFLGVCVASVAGLAQAQYMDCDYFSGAYVGVNAMYQSTNDKYTLDKTVIKQSRDLDIYAGHDGWGGGLFAGYGKLMNQMYLGAEIYGKAAVGKQKLVSYGDEQYAAMKSPYSYGAMAKIGYLVSPQALVYLGLGAENTRFKLIETVQKDDQTVGDIDLLDSHKWGFVPSVGMNLALDCNWQIGAKLSYAAYRSLDLTSDNGKIGTISPRRASFDLNVTYHFV